MPATLENILNRVGPTLSSVVVKELAREHRISAVAARKQVSRAIARGSVQRLEGVIFPNREHFLFLEHHRHSQNLVVSLREALIQQGTALGRALCGLEARRGATFGHFFPIVTGLPLARAKKQVPHAHVEEVLRRLRLIATCEVAGGDEALVLTGSDGMTDRRRAVLLVEDLVLSAVRVYLKNTAWTSSGVPKVRERGKPLPMVGQFAWDFSAPTYLAALKTGPNGPGFIAGDILMDRQVTLQDLWPFFAKFDSLLNQRRTHRIQPLLIADALESDALEELRKRGVLILMPRTVFGDEVARDLRELVTTIEGAAARVADNPEAVFHLIERLSKIEGAATNLRGVVIELIIAHLFKKQGYEIRIREEVFGDGGLAEIDVRAVRGKELICCECKGKGPTGLVEVKDIEDWDKRARPRISAWMKERRETDRRFEFYSSTDYTEDARALCEQLQAQYVHVPIRFYKGTDVIAKLQEMNDQSLVRIFREQFRQERFDSANQKPNSSVESWVQPMPEAPREAAA